MGKPDGLSLQDHVLGFSPHRNLGDYRRYGMTEQKYRTAMKRLGQ